MSAFAKSAPVPTLGETYDMGFERGQIFKQEQIIKLLEGHKLPKCDSSECNCWDITGLETAIALIKGEK